MRTITRSKWFWPVLALLLTTANAQNDDAVASLDFVEPKFGQVFEAQSTIRLKVVAVDSHGDIRLVNFYANGEFIGKSEHLTRDAVIPGRPREHIFEWGKVPSGEYTLVAKATATVGLAVQSHPVRIVVKPIPDVPAGFIPPGAQWRHYNRATPPGGEWNKPGFDDSGWRLGAAELGYGDGDEATRTEGAELQPHPVTAYFRHAFTVEDPSTVKNLAVRLVRDDGAVVYLNGTEILRENMPGGEITPETLATETVGNEGERTYYRRVVPATALVAGRNVLAVEIHQVNVSSSDISFNLHLAATEEEPAGETPVVSIVAADPDARESGVLAAVFPGRFVLVRTGSAERELSVSLSYEGTATAGADYNELPRTVTFAANRRELAIDVIPKNDGAREERETVIARLLQPEAVNPPYRVDPAKGSATVYIADANGEPELPLVTIVATVPETAEPGPTVRVVQGEVTVSRSGEAERELSVWLDVAGTATESKDYEAIPRRVTFPVGVKSLALKVTALDDLLVEPDETVVVKVVYPPTDGPQTYRIGEDRASARVTIHDTDNEPHPAQIRIVKPEEGAVFHAGSDIEIRAVAVDPKGYISRVEFFANEQKLGVSEIVFVVPPEPGTPIEHSFKWVGAPAGRYSLVAGAVDSAGAKVLSPAVHVAVEPDLNEPPVVSVVATQAITSEPHPLALIAPGVFTVSRTGRMDTALSVHFMLKGTASSQADYEPITSPVTIPAGESKAQVMVLAKMDNLVEGNETVVLTLVHPPTAGPMLLYRIAPDRETATVSIRDMDSPRHARIEITKPVEGENFAVGDEIEINAVAVDPNGYIPQVTFYADGEKIGESVIAFFTAPEPGTPIHHTFTWKTAPAGEHTLTVRGVDSNGAPVTSAPVTITVGEPRLPVVTMRFLPDFTLAPWPNADHAPGMVEVARTGSTAEALLVFFEVGGTATPEADYVRLGQSVLFEKGQARELIKVEAIDDELVEGKETVVLKLRPAPETIDSIHPTEYVIHPEKNHATVTILDNDHPGEERVVLALSTRDEVAVEPWGATEINTGVVLVKRIGGPLNVAVRAQYKLGGTAKNGEDYASLRGWVEVPAGEHAAEIVIVPNRDSIQEPDEQVEITLEEPVCPAIAPTPPECYLVGQPATAKVVIKDNFPDPAATVSIHSPRDGAVFSLGAVIEITARVTFLVDDSARPVPGVSKLEIYAGSTVLARNENHTGIEFRWENAPEGPHVIYAKATLADGSEAKSHPVRIMVVEKERDSFVSRELPEGYVPGQVFVVTLNAEPRQGTSAWGVEDRAPRGWAVSAISHEGSFDEATGKVKFGPYTDATARTLTYSVTPPGSAEGRQEFAGTSSANGRTYPIKGDHKISAQHLHHPADLDSNSTLVLNEVTAYAAAWKESATWPRDPNPIPVGYVTRAGYLWKNGEAYRFDERLGAPPICWVPAADGPVASAKEAQKVHASRSITPAPDGGGAVNVKIVVEPGEQVNAYAVVEKLPREWRVTNITGDGRYDSTTGTIRWGLFLDGNARTLEYRATAASDAVRASHFHGEVSWNGYSTKIEGHRLVVSGRGDELNIPGIHKETSGRVKLRLSAPPGQICTLEASADLKTWVEVDAIYLPDGTVEIEEDAGVSGQKYFRLRAE